MQIKQKQLKHEILKKAYDFLLKRTEQKALFFKNHILQLNIQIQFFCNRSVETFNNANDISNAARQKLVRTQ